MNNLPSEESVEQLKKVFEQTQHPQHIADNQIQDWFTEEELNDDLTVKEEY